MFAESFCYLLRHLHINFYNNYFYIFDIYMFFQEMVK